MNFLADESCAASVIRALREAGHNVLAIAEIAAGASDEQVSIKRRARNACCLLKISISVIWSSLADSPQSASS